MKTYTAQKLVDEVHRMYGLQSDITLAIRCLKSNQQATPEDYFDFLVKYMEEEE